jgi:hypothetical protein
MVGIGGCDVEEDVMLRLCEEGERKERKVETKASPKEFTPA